MIGHANIFMTIHQAINYANSTAANIEGSITGDKAIQRKAIVTLVHVCDRTNLERYCDKIYRPKEDVVEEMEGQLQVSFSLFASHLI